MHTTVPPSYVQENALVADSEQHEMAQAAIDPSFVEDEYLRATNPNLIKLSPLDDFSHAPWMELTPAYFDNNNATTVTPQDARKARIAALPKLQTKFDNEDQPIKETTELPPSSITIDSEISLSYSDLLDYYTIPTPTLSYRSGDLSASSSNYDSEDVASSNDPLSPEPVDDDIAQRAADYSPARCGFHSSIPCTYDVFSPDRRDVVVLPGIDEVISGPPSWDLTIFQPRTSRTFSPSSADAVSPGYKPFPSTSNTPCLDVESISPFTLAPAIPLPSPPLEGINALLRDMDVAKEELHEKVRILKLARENGWDMVRTQDWIVRLALFKYEHKYRDFEEAVATLKAGRREEEEEEGSEGAAVVGLPRWRSSSLDSEPESESGAELESASALSINDPVCACGGELMERERVCVECYEAETLLMYGP